MMKKLLSIVLVIAMMLSMVVVALPTSALTVPGSTEKPSGSTGTTSATPVPEDFDFEAKYPAGEGWKAITSLDDLKAIKFDANDGVNKYYLKNDIEVTGIEAGGDYYVVKGWNGTEDVVFEGNGFTIKFVDCAASIFGGGTKKFTAKNLNLTGNMVVPANHNNHVAPLIMHGFNDLITLENVHSSVNITFAARETGLKGTVGGIVGKTDRAIDAENVSFTGSIDMGAVENINPDTDILYRSIGGVVGTLRKGDYRKFNNVTVDATIKASGKNVQNVGGVVGYALFATEITNATVNADITVGGEGEKFVGGVIGSSNVETADKPSKIDNVVADVNISVDSAAVTNVGGIVGGAISANISNVLVKGDIVAKGSGRTGTAGVLGTIKGNTVTITNATNEASVKVTGCGWNAGLGGVLGVTNGENCVAVIDGAVNNGTVDATAGVYRGGIAGILWGAKADFDNCVNNGKVGGLGGDVGGIIGVTNGDTTIDNCVNNGEISGAAFAGGILGQAYAAGTIKVTACGNTGNVTTTGDAGGIVCEPGTTTEVTNCINTGVVKAGAGKNVGGVVGIVKDNATITDSIDASVELTEEADIALAKKLKFDILGISSLGSKGTTKATPVAADFDYEAAYPAADGWKAVSDLAGLKAMAYGGKYYLTNDIEITGITGATIIGGWPGNGTLELAGNGHTLVWKDGYASLINGAGGGVTITFKDLNLAGTLTVPKDGEQHIGPLVKHGVDGTIVLKNVHSSVDIVFADGVTSIGGSIGGVIGKTSGTADFENVSFTGSIDVPANATNADWAYVGGIAGFISKVKTMKDITVAAEINVSGNNYKDVGALTGRFGSETTVTGATIVASVKVSGEGETTIGGLAGTANKALTIDNTFINVGIYNNAVAANKVAGVVAKAAADLKISNTEVYGYVELTGNEEAKYDSVCVEAGTKAVDESVVIAITSNAVTPPVDVTPTGSAGTTAATPVEEGFDFAAKYPEGWIALSTLDELKAIKYGGKYYLKNDIVITGTTGAILGGWPGEGTVEIAGNGFSLIWQDSYSSLINGGGNGTKLIAYDLNLSGTMLVNGKGENVAPLVQHNLGTVELTNVHSSVDIKFADNIKEVHNAVSGMIGKMDDGTLTAENVSFTGSITINADQKQGYAPGIGGIAGAAFGTLNATDVTVDAEINVNGGGNENFGAIAGMVGEANITNATVDVDIAVDGDGDKAIGGLVGKANKGVTIENAAVEVELTNDAKAANHIGGFAGYVTNVLTVTEARVEGKATVIGNENAIFDEICAHAADRVLAYNVSSDFSGEDAGDSFVPTVVVTDPAELEAAGYKPIRTEEELKTRADGGLYYLANDIIFTSGTGSNLLNATINGNGHTVTFAGGQAIVNWGSGVTVENLIMTGKVEVTGGEHYGPLCIHGFDGNVTFRNVHSSVEITLTKDNKGAIGGIVGKMHAGGPTMENVSFTGSINGGNVKLTGGESYRNTIGGIAGWVQNVNVDGVYVDAEFISANDGLNAVGGVFGAFSGGTIKNAQVRGSIDATAATSNGDNNHAGVVGGIAGRALNSNEKATIIENCYNLMTSVSGQRAGGIVGMAEAKNFSIINCFNASDVTATKTSGLKSAGGILGVYEAQNGTNVVIDGCVNTGSVYVAAQAYRETDSWVMAGGIAGTSHSAITISNCINLGAVTTNTPDNPEWGAFPIMNGAEYSGANTDINVGAFKGENNKYYAPAMGAKPADMCKLGVATPISDLRDILGKTDFPADAFIAENVTLTDLFRDPAECTDAYKKEFEKAKEALIEAIEKLPADATMKDVYLLETELFRIYMNRNYLASLIKEIENAEATVVGKLYTASTWAAYAEALANAKYVVSQGALLPGTEATKALNALKTAVNGLVEGGVISSAEDFKLLEGATGTFELIADIDIMTSAGKAVSNFKGTLIGNGHTITVRNNLFASLDGATIKDLVIESNRPQGYILTIFGEAKGNVTISNVVVNAASVDGAVFFSAGAAGSTITIDNCVNNAVIDGEGFVSESKGNVVIKNSLNMANVNGSASLVGSAENVTIDTVLVVGNMAADKVNGFVTKATALTIKNAYYTGMVTAQEAKAIAGVDGTFENVYAWALDAAGNVIAGSTAAEVIASGEVAYVINAALKAAGNDAMLFQMIGRDSVPTLGNKAPDGSNVVIVKDGKYTNETPVFNTPVLPQTPTIVDTTALSAAIAAAEALVEDDYTEASWTSLQAALKAAKEALTSLDEAAIAKAKATLETAVLALTPKTDKVAPVDYAALDAAIAEAEALKQADYTAATWSTLQTMLNLAKNAKTAASQAAVDQAVASLRSAIRGLKAPTAEAEKPAVTDPVTTDDGCGSAISGAAVIVCAVIALGTGISFKKKED